MAREKNSGKVISAATATVMIATDSPMRRQLPTNSAPCVQAEEHIRIVAQPVNLNWWLDGLNTPKEADSSSVNRSARIP